MEGLGHDIAAGNDDALVSEHGDGDSDELSVAHVLLHHPLAIDHGLLMRLWPVDPRQVLTEFQRHIGHAVLLLFLGRLDSLRDVLLLLVLLHERVDVVHFGSHLLGHASDQVRLVSLWPILS